MIRKLAGILDKARRVESSLAAKVEGAASKVTGAPSVRPPLEVVHAVVEAVAAEVQPAGRGQRVFPFNQIRIVFASPNPRSKAHLEAVLGGPQPLEARVKERLAGAGCSVADLAVNVAFAAKARPDWVAPEFHLEFERVAVASTPEEPELVTRLDLVVLEGTATRTSFSFTPGSIAIGRGAEVRDSRGRLIRTNHVVFTEGGGEVNQTVSRKHARIEHDVASRTYRLFDDGSALGTSLIRNGKGHTIQRGTRGMVLQNADELVVGRARLKVKLHQH